MPALSDIHGRYSPSPLARGAPTAELSVVRIGRSFVFLDGIAAVDDNHLAGHVGCLFTREEGDSSSDFLRTPGAAHRRVSASDNFLLGLRRRFNPAGGYSIYRDSAAGNLERKAARQPDHSSFGRTVGRCARIADEWPGD